MQVSACVVSGSKKGTNLINGLDEGLSVHIIRSLVDPTLSLPYVDCHIDVPRVLASITDSEYAFCCAVSLANLQEPMCLPAAALWAQDQLNPPLGADPSVQRSSVHGSQESAAPSGHVSAGSCRPSISMSGPKPLQKAPASPQVSNTVRATLCFGSVELALHNRQSEQCILPLATLRASDLFINYVSDAPGAMDVRLCLPRLEAHDNREARRARSSHVLSSTFHLAGSGGAVPAMPRPMGTGSPLDVGTLELVGPSMLTAHYICSSDGAQDVALRLQRPTLVAEVDFMAAMLKFVMPSFALGAEPTPFLRRDFQYAFAAMFLCVLLPLQVSAFLCQCHAILSLLLQL
jgi:hypothetical protein